jgi:hypothetical protein
MGNSVGFFRFACYINMGMWSASSHKAERRLFGVGAAAAWRDNHPLGEFRGRDPCTALAAPIDSKSDVAALLSALGARMSWRVISHAFSSANGPDPDRERGRGVTSRPGPCASDQLATQSEF